MFVFWHVAVVIVIVSFLSNRNKLELQCTYLTDIHLSNFTSHVVVAKQSLGLVSFTISGAFLLLSVLLFLKPEHFFWLV